MVTKTKARRTRVSKADIAKAREQILIKPVLVKQTIEKTDTQPKRKKDFWLSTLYPDNYGDDIYFSGDGLAWGTDANLESLCVGETENVLAIIRGEKPIPDNACPHTKRILSKLLKDIEEGKEENAEPKRERNRGHYIIRRKPSRSLRNRR